MRKLILPVMLPIEKKFQKFSEVLPKAIGNPRYHWCHLELRTYFDYNGILNGDTAQIVWVLAQGKLSHPDMGVRGLIKKSNVAMIGTIDDPIDDLQWHKKLAKDPTFDIMVVPSFRPDKAFNLDKPGWRYYIAKLAESSGVKIANLESLKTALTTRIAYFAENGCRTSDHGLDYMAFREATKEELDAIAKRGLAGEKCPVEDAEKLRTALLQHCAQEYTKHDIAMQIHYNCLRNPNSKMLEAVGPDTGFDCIGPNNGGKALAKLLDTLYRKDALPRTILYSLDPGDNAFLDTLIGAFQGTEAAGKLQHGSAWWINDNKRGMEDQLISLANLSLLGNFVGMLTDSRSFLSYTRHEYFRRILCALIGKWVEDGEYPNDPDTLKVLVQDICFYNAKHYFGI